MWHFVFGPVIPDISKYPSVFVFRAKVQDPEGEGTSIFRTVGNWNYTPSDVASH